MFSRKKGQEIILDIQTILHSKQLYENSYRLEPHMVFNTVVAEEKINDIVDAFASKYYIRSDAVQGRELLKSLATVFRRQSDV